MFSVFSFQFSGFGFRFSGVGFRVSGFGFRALVEVPLPLLGLHVVQNVGFPERIGRHHKRGLRRGGGQLDRQEEEALYIVLGVRVRVRVRIRVRVRVKVRVRVRVKG